MICGVIQITVYGLLGLCYVLLFFVRPGTMAMMNSSVCKKCINHEYNRLKNDSWTTDDMNLWINVGRVYCPMSLTVVSNYADTKGPPPSWCSHKLEHAVSVAMSHLEGDHRREKRKTK
jgi:hypothetical protein